MSARDIFIISDLHIGDGGSRDNFEPGGRTRQLHQFLDHVGAEGSELFILGDLFELWQMNTSRIFTYRQPLLDHLARLPLTYVPGNHDVDLLHFIGSGLFKHPFFEKIRRPIVRELGSRRFHFSHGHETDPFNNSENPGFGQMLTIFSGLFEDQNGSPLLRSGGEVDYVLEAFGESMLALWTAATAGLAAKAGSEKNIQPQHALTPAQNPDRLTEHLAGVGAARARDGWDVAVCGHTHTAGQVGDWYYNSGSWVGSTNQYLRIDSEGNVRSFEWKSGQPLERNTPVIRPGVEAEKNPLKKATANVRLLFPRPTKPEHSRLILMGQGALALGLGIWILSISFAQGQDAALLVLVSAFGWYALLDGVFSWLGSSREHAVKRTVDRLRSSLSILLGLVFLVRVEAISIFSVLVGVWALLSGGLRAAAAALFSGVVEARWLWIVGIGSLVAGLVLLLLPPSAIPLARVAASYLCFHGIGELLAGIFARRRDVLNP